MNFSDPNSQLSSFNFELCTSKKYLKKYLNLLSVNKSTLHFIFCEILLHMDLNLFSTLHWGNFLFASNIFLLLGKKEVFRSDKRVRNGAMIFCLTLATLECENVWKFQANIFVGNFNWKYLWRAFRHSSSIYQPVISQSSASHQVVIM